MFERQHITDSAKLADALLKQVQKEDPRTALIAFAISANMAMRACGINRKQLIELIGYIDEGAGYDQGNSGRAAESALLWTPGH